jgi:glycosyltransferase involved in cell wall biosynthesis
MVSILTPVYNDEKCLAECIESVLAQTYANWKYIIVNNRSTDCTLETAQRYARMDQRIRIHNNQTFVGMIENHNIAFQLISPASSYCKMVHADDWLFPECITQMVRVAQSSHLPATLASDKVQVVAIVELMRQRAEELARWYGIAPLIVPRVQDVLGDIDGAVIATPNDTHMSIALACLEAGVPTLIEKPLASTYAEGEAIARAGQAYGKVVAVGYVVRFRESILLLGDLLKAGYFGTVRRFAHQVGTRGGWAPMSSYNLSRKATGGGVLVVTGTHFLDCMLHFWGYPDD